MDLRGITNRFLVLEEELELGGGSEPPLWEHTRFWLQQRLLRELGFIDEGHASADLSPGEKVARTGKNLIHRSPFLAGDAEVLIYGHERRKKRSNGVWVDIYTDPVVEAAGWDAVHVERPHTGGHRSPAKSDRLRYTDCIEYGGEIVRRLVPDGRLLDASERAYWGRVDRAFEEEFGVGLGITESIMSAAGLRIGRVPMWRAVIRRVDPAIALVIVSYGRESFIEACQREGVPVVELQHGVIYPEHLGYHYPAGREKRTFPDYLLTFGEFWKDAVDLPIPDSRVIPAGYPELERGRERYEGVESSDTVLFISQGTIGAELSRVAVEVAESVDRKIVYKLHPGEYGRWREAYPWLVDASDSGHIQISEGEKPLYRLFAESSTQVGVYSTALYEGLAFGLETYLLDTSGVSSMRRLVAEGGATVVADTDGLVEKLTRRRQAARSIDIDRVFRPGAIDNIVSSIEDLRES